MSNDVLYPLLIGAGCLVLVVVIHLLTRPRPSRADIRVPAAIADESAVSTMTTSPALALGAWHRDHEAVVLDFIARHDAVTEIDVDHDDDTSDNPTPGHATPDTDDIDDTGDHDDADDYEQPVSEDGDQPAASADRSADDETAVLDDGVIDHAFEVAVAAHPAPEMRAELAALRAAAEATVRARQSRDEAATERHRAVYLAYRDVWLERLWQFGRDRSRIGDLRRSPPRDVV